MTKTLFKRVVTILCAGMLLTCQLSSFGAATSTTTASKGGSGKAGGGKGGAAGKGGGGASAAGPKGASAGAKASKANRVAMLGKKAEMKRKKQARMAKLQKLSSNPAARDRVSNMVAQIRKSQDTQILAAEQRLSSGQGQLHKNVAQIVAAVVPGATDMSKYEVTKPILGEVMTGPPVVTSNNTNLTSNIHYEVVKAKVFDVKEKSVAPDGTTILTTVMQVKIPLRPRVQFNEPKPPAN